MSAPPRGCSIVMMAVVAVTACNRGNESQGTASGPVPAPETAAAPATATAGPATTAAAPGAAHDAAASLPWETGPACDADGELDPVLGVPCLYTWATPAGPTPLVVHLDDLMELRLVAELDGARTLAVHLPETNMARGTRLHLRPQPDQRLAVVLVEDRSEGGTEPVTAEAWLLSRADNAIEVVPLDKKKEPWPAWARLPDEIWSSPEEPIDHLDRLRVVSSYRVRVGISDDGKATIALAEGEPPEDVRPLLGTHTLW